jgi:hypothetical protein
MRARCLRGAADANHESRFARARARFDPREASLAQLSKKKFERLNRRSPNASHVRGDSFQANASARATDQSARADSKEVPISSIFLSSRKNHREIDACARDAREDDEDDRA